MQNRHNDLSTSETIIVALHTLTLPLKYQLLNMGPRDLPLDVFDCIMEMLACLDDFDTLETCSMACKQLRPLCLRFMLEKIRIADNDVERPSRPIDRVKDLLDKNPTLSRYIKCLEVYIEPMELDNANFPIILNQLRNLHTLSISGRNRRLYMLGTSLPPIPEPLRMSFEQLIRMPSLINLQLFFLDDFPIPSFLAASTSLKNLTVSYMDIPTDSPGNIIFGSNPPLLRSFTVALDGSINIGRSLLTSKRPDGLPVIDFSALENLTIHTINSNHTAENEMMKMYLYVSTKLRSLRLQVDDTFAAFRVDFVNHIHPLSIKTLEHLELDFVAEGECDPYFGAHDELARLMSAGCPLQTLDLDITLLSHHEYFMNPQVWNKIDILSNYTTLRNVSLQIYICELLPTEADIFIRRLSEILRATFGMLLNEPRIEFSFIVS